MNKKEEKIDTIKKVQIKKIAMIAMLQLVVAIYTLSTVAAKFASGAEFMSLKFIICYSIEILILGVYAILWQQIIKRMELSIAYANKAISLLWSIVWAVLFFNETVTVKNVIGICIVIIGTMVVNLDEH